MEIGSVFLILAVLVIAGIYLYAPFTLRAQTIYNNDEEHNISTLKAERDRVINSLQELDFDFKLGKIPADDYPIQRQALLQKGAETLRQLDELEKTFSSQDVEARIENAAEKKRADSSTKSEVDDEELEIMIKSRKKQMQNKSAGFCPACGRPVLITDKFCPTCGKPLS